MVLFVILGALSKTRTLSREDKEDNRDKQYIIIEDRTRSEVTERIEDAMKLCDPTKKKYEFHVPSSGKAKYEPKMGHFCLPRIKGRFKKRSTEDPKTAKKAVRIFFILDVILRRLKENRFINQRKIFYIDQGLFMDQEFLEAWNKRKKWLLRNKEGYMLRSNKSKNKGLLRNKQEGSMLRSNKSKNEGLLRNKQGKKGLISKTYKLKKGLISQEDYNKEVKKAYTSNFLPLISEICILLETTRISMKISIPTRGYVVGEVKLCINGDESLSCEHGRIIPMKALHITKIETKGQIRFILIVEKFTIYSDLIDLGFHRKHKCVVITSKGFPDIATRSLVRKLSDELKVPIYGLVDMNAYGISILSIFMVGSQNRAFDNLHLSVPRLVWIGVVPSDVAKLPEIPSTPMTSTECAMLNTLKDLPHPQAHLFKDMLVFQYDVNIDSVVDYYGGIEQYLVDKIPEMAETGVTSS